MIRSTGTVSVLGQGAVLAHEFGEDGGGGARLLHQRVGPACGGRVVGRVLRGRQCRPPARHGGRHLPRALLLNLCSQLQGRKKKKVRL
jgi:hypothetical protein